MSKLYVILVNDRFKSIYPYTIDEVKEEINKFKKYNATVDYIIYELNEVNIEN